MLGAAYVAFAGKTTWAQDPATRSEPVNSAQSDAQPAADPGDIVVTGSRISRGGFSAPTPVSVVGADRLEQRGVTNIGDALNELPSFRSTTGPASQGLSETGYIGGRILDLRGLGPVRTLTLVDGKRFVPATLQGTVDTNLIPSVLLERAEVVTGGASAAYGSDAVAGVVNLIINGRLEGFKGSAQSGITQEGDDRQTLLSLAGGSKIGGNLHLIAGLEYERSTGIGNCYQRDWCATETLNFGRPPGVTNIPANNILSGVRPSTISRRGVINSSRTAAGTAFSNTTDPLRGITFNPDGSARFFQYGTGLGTVANSVNSLYMVGGEGEGENGYFDALPLKSPTERIAAYGRLTWDVSDDITATLDVSYGRLRARHGVREYKDAETVIRRDNAFIDLLPQSTDPRLNIRNILNVNPNIASFRLGRTYNDIGVGRTLARNETFRTVASIKGKLGEKWNWDAYYEFGRNNFHSTVYNASITGNYNRAIDAVRDPASGQIVCRALSSLNTDPASRAAAAGCVPLNPFGNLTTPAAQAYVSTDAFQKNRTTQHVIAGNLNGTLVDMWAGPLSIAVGGEFRSDKITGETDPFSQNLLLFQGGGSLVQGKVDVTEGYVEAELPLARDMTLLQELSLNGAIRRTHYNRRGADSESTVNATTWKLGAVWEPVEWLRLRGTRSRDIRAPNIAELFGPTTQGFNIVNDRQNGGSQIQPRVLSGSNPDLVPEVADTWTVGVVLQPRSGGFLGRLRASVDYYDIKINDAISNIGGQTIVDRCFQGATEFCGLITRDAAGLLTRIVDTQQNVNQLITRGLDVEVTYRQPLGTMGDLDLRLLATITDKLVTRDSAGSTDRAGQTGLRGGTVPGVPDYILDGLLTWSRDALTVSAHARYIPDGFYNSSFIGPDQEGYTVGATNSSNINSVPDAIYFDLMTQVEFLKDGGRNATFFFGVDNVFDKDPPLVPGANGVGNNLLFSPIGRAYKAGIRFGF
jgi:outer membrane receptor protein involved in Fe transport